MTATEVVILAGGSGFVASAIAWSIVYTLYPRRCSCMGGGR